MTALLLAAVGGWLVASVVDRATLTEAHRTIRHATTRTLRWLNRGRFVVSTERPVNHEAIRARVAARRQ